MMRSLRREDLACSSFPLAVDPNCTSLGEYSDEHEHGRACEAARSEQVRSKRRHLRSTISAPAHPLQLQPRTRYMEVRTLDRATTDA